MFVVAFNPYAGSQYYMTKKDGCYLCCGCPLSARCYKTYAGALRFLKELEVWSSCDPSRLEIIDFGDLYE